MVVEKFKNDRFTVCMEYFPVPSGDYTLSLIDLLTNNIIYQRSNDSVTLYAKFQELVEQVKNFKV